MKILNNCKSNVREILFDLRPGIDVKKRFALGRKSLFLAQTLYQPDWEDVKIAAIQSKTFMMNAI